MCKFRCASLFSTGSRVGHYFHGCVPSSVRGLGRSGASAGMPVVHCTGILLVRTRVCGRRKRPRGTIPLVGRMEEMRKSVPKVSKRSCRTMGTRVRRRHLVRFTMRGFHFCSLHH